MIRENFPGYDVRRLRCFDAIPCFRQLESAIGHLYRLSPEEVAALKLKYPDEEGDLCTLCDATLPDALSKVLTSSAVLRLYMSFEMPSNVRPLGDAIQGGPEVLPQLSVYQQNNHLCSNGLGHLQNAFTYFKPLQSMRLWHEEEGLLEGYPVMWGAATSFPVASFLANLTVGADFGEVVDQSRPIVWAQAWCDFFLAFLRDHARNGSPSLKVLKIAGSRTKDGDQFTIHAVEDLNAGFDMWGRFYVCLNKNWGWGRSGGRCAPEAYFLTEAVCVKTGQNPGCDVPVSLYLVADKGQRHSPRELHLLRLSEVPDNIMEKARWGRREMTEHYSEWSNKPAWAGRGG